ncbi:MAG: hypothetical protein M3450_06460 [Actinomycetota bacterium]|nr:hypothetical protein [Actinomycetota bacterium]
MADPPRYSDTADDTGVEPDRASPTRTPLWVWVVGIVVLGTSLAMLRGMIVPLILNGLGGH